MAPFEWYEGHSRELATAVITVPSGFETDFDSTPLVARVFLWFLLIGRKKGRRASALHDWCYATDPLFHLGYTKEDYDNVYFTAMVAEGVPEKTALRMRKALNTWISDDIWDNYRRAER